MGGAYGGEEYGTVISPGYERNVNGGMFIFVPVSGKYGTEFVRKHVGWFKHDVNIDYDNTAVLKMGPVKDWWLNKVNYASLDSRPDHNTKRAFCEGREHSTFPHVYEVKTDNYDPYGMSSDYTFKRTCLASYRDNYGWEYCQASEDKWGNKNCPGSGGSHYRRLSDEGLSKYDDVEDTFVPSEALVEDEASEGRKLMYQSNRYCFKFNKLMIRGRFCAFHSTVYPPDKY